MTPEDALSREQVEELFDHLCHPGDYWGRVQQFLTHDARQREEIKRLTIIVENRNALATHYQKSVDDLQRHLAQVQVRVAESETYLEQQRVATYQAVEREHTLKARVRKLEEALKTAICELECSGLAHDHPTITQLQHAMDGTPKFNKTFCSQCGQEFGPGDHGYSHCHDHRHVMKC